MRRLIGLVFALTPLCASAQDASRGDVTSLRSYSASDPSAPEVTEENLLASERFWPFQVSVLGSWTPPGRQEPLPEDFAGVLIRVEPGGVARIDFGRDGLHDVSIARTDLVARANQVRRGELEKLAPNFVLAIGPRLVDSEAGQLQKFDVERVLAQRAFLCVFADPESENFPALAAALAPLRSREGVLTILFPQGHDPDKTLREKLRALGWTVPFLYDHLAEPYTHTLLETEIRMPALMLQSREGRVFLQSSWGPDTLPNLDAALRGALGDLRTATPSAE